MGAVLFILLLVVPIAELWVIVTVASQIGVLETLVLLIVVSVAGAYLLKQQGLATWARLQRSLAEGRMPTAEVTDGALILLGGALLLTPGFITDIVGLVLLVPVTRAVVKRMSRRLLRSMAERRFVPPGSRRIYDATVVQSRRSESRTNPPPSETLPRAEGDSPDRG